MMQKHRIYTNIGRDQKINVEVKQDFDIMEVLSLKFTQKDIYASGNCSEYGVVVGRVSANSGYGVPNARVSIFIPLDSLDEDDPVISALYPYKDISDKDENGYRYNLLPERKQHPGHAPTGTFMDQQDILTREECLEVFEKYYKYTVKTNSSGDFMIWGVPVGSQTLHIDIDLSDIGCFSFRPYDFIKKGYPITDFENYYTFKSSADIDTLPQIVSFDKVVEVYPFWGNEELCEIAITRTDFDLSERNIKIEPTAIILLSSMTDDNSHSIKRSGKIRKNSGYKCNLQTLGGSIQCVRFTGGSVIGTDGYSTYPELEYYELNQEIDDNGVAMIQFPMNMEYVYTNEFGEEEITNDPNKGIPTTAIARFKFGLNFNSNKIATANYLVPNIREYNPSSNGSNNKYEYQEGMLASYQFSDNFEDYITIIPPTGVTISSTNYDVSVKGHKTGLMLGTNNNGIPEDYFYKFIFNKVYTVSSFQGSYYESVKRDAFLGVKEIRPNSEEDCASSTNYFPTNFGFKNRIKFNLLLSQVVLFIQYIYSIILVKFAELIGKFAYTVGKLFYDIYFGWPFNWRPFVRISERFLDWAYGIQDKFTQTLALTIYPDCEECTQDDVVAQTDVSFANEYCRVAEVKLRAYRTWVYNDMIFFYTYDSDAAINFRNLPTELSFLGGPGQEFETEMARDPSSLCVTGDTVTYYGMQSLSGETINLPNDNNHSRYYAEVYCIGGETKFPNFIGFFNLQGTTISGLIPLTFNHSNLTPTGQIGMVLPFWIGENPWYPSWNDITGMNLFDLESSGDPVDVNTMEMLVRIYDRACPKTFETEPPALELETGCQKYDKPYNESMVLKHLWSTGTDYGTVTNPTFPENGYPTGWAEVYTTVSPPVGYNNLLSSIIAGNNTIRLPRFVAWTKIPSSTYDRQTKSGFSEFRDGVFIIIPVIRGTSKNTLAIQEWYRRKRVGLSFCGGIINYSFIDNWLNGILYFFKFDKRIKWDNENEWDLNQRGSKFPRELVFYNILHKEFYYRSCPFYMNEFIGQRNEDNDKNILHPTTFYDLGTRDDFLSEICTDTRIDPVCSVVREIGNTSYQDPSNIVEHTINYRMDISASKFNVNDFFSGRQYGSNIHVFDGDVLQLMSINCEAGIEAFDLDTSHYYMYNGELLDPENINFGSFFRDGSQWGPTPIDFKLDFNGVYMRLCLNNRLGDYSQIVPFYLWNKKDEGFGYIDKQEWDRTEIASMPLQRIFSISGVTEQNTNYLMPDGEEEYILKPMTITHDTFSVTGSTEDMLERFEVISYYPPDTTDGGATQYVEGDLWLYVPSTSGTTSNPQGGWIYVVVNKTWVLQPDPYIDGYRETFIPQTALNYWGEKQVLSTPFLFYFGLIPGKTSLDLLMKSFGGVGAFPSEETIICMVNDIVTPTVSVTPTVTPTPIVTPTVPSDISEIYFDPAGVSGGDARLAVNNPLGRLFTITFEYQLTAAVDNIWSMGGNPNQTTTYLYISTNNGLTWTEIDSVYAEISGGNYPNDQYDYQQKTGTHIINGVTNVSNVLVRIDYACATAQDYQAGDGYVTIMYASADSGTVNVICDNTFQVGCGIVGNLYCVVVPTPTPTVTVTVTPPQLFLGFAPYDGAWSWGQSGDGYAVIMAMRYENIEEFALDFAPAWITVEAWDTGHWRVMTPDMYFTTPNVDSIRIYPNSVNNNYTARGGEITFKNWDGDVMNYFDGTFSSRLYANQDRMPIGVSFEWVDNLPVCCGAGCHIAYQVEDPLLFTDPEHGMSMGSFDYNISFWPYFDCEDQYVAWSIYRVSPNPIVLASGSGSTTGIRLRPGHVATKVGTLSQAISDGDIIRITIGTGLMLIE